MSSVIPLDTCSNLHARTVTIKNGESESEATPLHGEAVVGFFMPAAWTAASIGSKVGIASDAMKTVRGASVTIDAVADVDKFIPFPFTDAAFAPYFSLTSIDGNGAAVAQGADRAFTVITRKLLS